MAPATSPTDLEMMTEWSRQRTAECEPTVAYYTSLFGPALGVAP